MADTTQSTHLVIARQHTLLRWEALRHRHLPSKNRQTAMHFRRGLGGRDLVCHPHPAHPNCQLQHGNPLSPFRKASGFQLRLPPQTRLHLTGVSATEPLSLYHLQSTKHVGLLRDCRVI
jgi:hypothetical protein